MAWDDLIGRRHKNGVFRRTHKQMEKSKMLHWMPTRGGGLATRMLDSQATRVPTDFLLYFAGASMLGSLALQLSGKKEHAMFIGQWVPTLLILGIYNRFFSHK